MLSSKDIADLEKKHLKYTLKKRFQILSYILLFSLLSFSLLYYIFFINSSKIIKRPKNTYDKNITKKISNLISQNEKSISKKIIKTETIKQESNSTNSTKSISNQDINLTMQKKSKTVDANTIKITKTKDKVEEKKNNLEFKLRPSDTQHIDNIIRKRLTFTLQIPAKNRKTFYKKEIKSTETVNKNDTIIEKDRKRPKINIKMRDIDSIQYLKNKFKKTHDIVFALMLCENYYSQKDFENSLKWSIIANDIDSQSERSWIWFAKSKYRLHQKNDAIRALKSFLKLNDSQNIKSLLRDIVNGELND